MAHEPQIHRSELEKQNEELRRIQLELVDSRDRWAELFDFSPTAYLTLSADGDIQEANSAAARLLGVAREWMPSQNLTAFIASESQDAFYLHRQLAFTSGQKQACELALRRPDGSAFSAGMESVATPNGSRKERQLLVTFSDLTATRQKQIDRLLDISSLPDETPHPTLRIGADYILRYANAASDPLLSGCKCRLGQPVPAEWQDIVCGALERAAVQEHEIVTGGRSFQCTLTPFKDRGYVNLHANDITERKRAEVRLQASLREKEVLLKEIHHRVKNNLQVVSSLVSLQADALNQPGVREAFGSVRDQVRAMALVHEKLCRSDDVARMEFAGYARSLLHDLWHAHGALAASVKLTLDLQPLPLAVEIAVPCGLILNELAANALKHAFGGRSSGEVRVFLRGESDGRVCLRVGDNGIGLPAGLDLRQASSLGLRLVHILTDQLEGAVTARSEGGTEFELLFALPPPKGDGAASGGRVPAPDQPRPLQ